MEAKRSWWQNIKIYPVRFILIVFLTVVIVLIILSVLGYIFNWEWTGLGSYVSPPHPKDSDFQRSKTLWDWFNLLGVLAIPIVVGFGVAWYTTQQGKVADAENKDNQRENAFQTYIDKMSEFLLKEHLQESEIEHEILRNIARIQTLTVLPRLDDRRKGSVLQFLYDAALINNDKTIIGLKGADLSGVNLSGANLGYVPLHTYPYEDLEDIEPANLRGANLRDADLSKADLNQVDLSHSILIGANLSSANLEGVNLNAADLSGANLSHTELFQAVLRKAKLIGADLSGADLSGADLHNADLTGANLTNTLLSQLVELVEQEDGRTVDVHEANLNKANLKGAIGISNEELEKQTSLLKGATMPDGKIYS